MTSLLTKPNHTKPKPSIPSNPLKHNNVLTSNSLEKIKPILNHESKISNNIPLPLSSPINALLPPVFQTHESTLCEILISDFEFRPKHARARINSKVQWTIGENKTSHHSGIYSSENRNFVIGIPDLEEESDLLSRGQTFEFSFPKIGVFDVICSNYPRMQGKVEVYADDEDNTFKKVQHEMKARGLLLSGKQLDEKFFGQNNTKPILASPPPKKIQEKYPSSPYKNLEEAHSEEDTNVQELLQELNAKGPSIKSNKSKEKSRGRRREFKFGEKFTEEELFKQLRSRSEASDDEGDIKNFSVDTSDAYRMSDNEEEEREEEIESKYNEVLMSPSRFTIHEIMKMGAKLENSMIKQEKLEENKHAGKEKEIKIETDAPINQGDILIEIQQELENNNEQEEEKVVKVDDKQEKDSSPVSEKEVIVVNEQEKENLNEKPKKKNKHKKKKKKKTTAAAVQNPVEDKDEVLNVLEEDSVTKPAAQIEVKKKKEEKSDSLVVEVPPNNQSQKNGETKKLNNVQSESSKPQIKQEEVPKEDKKRSKDLVVVDKTKNKQEAQVSATSGKENNNKVLAKAPEKIQSDKNVPKVQQQHIEEQKFQTVTNIPKPTNKDTKNQNIKEPEIVKKKVEEDKRIPRIENKAIKGIAKIIETPKSSIQKNASKQPPTSSLNTPQAESAVKSVAMKTEEKNTIPVPATNSKQQNISKEIPVVEDSNKNMVNNNQDTANSKKKKKKSSKKRNNKELNRQSSLASDPKTEPESLEKIDSKPDLISPGLAEPNPAQDLVTVNTSEVNLPEEKEPEPQALGNEAFLAFLKDAVRSQSNSYQKSFRSNRSKSKNKKVQKEIDYTDEDDHIAALTAFLSNRYDYAEAFN